MVIFKRTYGNCSVVFNNLIKKKKPTVYQNVFGGSLLTTQKSTITKLSKKKLIGKDMGWLS